jgi:hypothetical protein
VPAVSPKIGAWGFAAGIEEKAKISRKADKSSQKKQLLDLGYTPTSRVD